MPAMDTAPPAADFVQLMAKPVWSFGDLCAVAGVPQSTLDLLLEESPMDGVFLLGRRRRVFREDAVAWLEAMRDRHRWTPRRNNRKP